MPIKTKAKGSRAERRVRKVLEESGYWVIKAGGSLGPWDLVALGEANGLLVQVKSGKDPRVGKVEYDQMRAFPNLRGFTKVLYLLKDRQQPVVRFIV